MSDIAGPPAPKDVQPSVRGTDKTSYVAKDPNNEEARSRDTPRERTPQDQQDTIKSRDPAVSIAATAAHLKSGQEIVETVARIDAEGRPIVATEDVTIALKPDAGLKPNDEVHLRIVDADKLVTADLLRQNANPVDPPIRLTVTVIEVHHPVDATNPKDLKPQTPADQRYQAPSATTATSTAIASNSPDDVALLVSGKAADKAALLPGGQTPTQPGAPDAQASAVRTSSADLATLIQQQSAGIPSAGAAPTAGQAVPPAAPVVPFGPVEGPGIGAPVNGIALTGEPVIFQLLNPAVSRVSPVEIATVTKVETLHASEARTLPVSTALVSATAGTSGELARVETTRGTFVLPAQASQGLNGELVRLVIDQSAGTPAQASTSQTVQSFQAQFSASGNPATDAARVIVAFTGSSPQAAASAVPQPVGDAPANVTGSITATVESVQTNSAFLGADGPKTDLKIQTSAGVVSLTAPAGFKPEVGTTLFIEQRAAGELSAQQSAPSLPTAAAGAQTAQMTAAVDALTAGATAAPLAPVTPNILAAWPAMEESLAALAGSGLAAASESLTAKSAQGGAKLTNSLLFFLAAAGRAGPGAWVGPGAERELASTSPSLLKNLQSDIRRMASLPGETIGEWRPIVLPFDARGTEAPLAALLLQQRGDIDPDAGGGQHGDEEHEQDESQRFILQVQFSVLGDIQLDGAIRQTTFDLTVRSANGFSEPLKQDLEGLFYGSLAANGFSGGISFVREDTFEIDAASLIENHLTAQGA